MTRRPPGFPRPDTFLPYTTLFRSHLVRVAPRDGGVLVERSGCGTGELADGVDVGAAFAVDEDAQHPAGQLQVVEVGPGSFDERRGDLVHTVSSGHRRLSPPPHRATAWAESNSVPAPRTIRADEHTSERQPINPNTIAV